MASADGPDLTFEAVLRWSGQAGNHVERHYFQDVERSPARCLAISSNAWQPPDPANVSRPRPAQDKYAAALPFSDPVYAVWGLRLDARS
jgi:hypothetical protein